MKESALLTLLSSIDWTSLGMLIATLALAFLTGAYVSLTKRLVKAQAYPNVLVYVHHDNTRPTILQIVIKNFGTATAKNINFEIYDKVPNRAFGLDPDTAAEAQTMEDGPIIEGIPSLPPNEERKIDWGQYGGLLKAIGDKQIKVKANYLNEENKKMITSSVLEIKSFKGTEGTVAVEYDPYKKIVEQLKSLNNEIRNVTSGNKIFKVQIENEKTKEKGVSV